MVINTKFSRQKSTGSHFTPEDLSDFLAEKVVDFCDFHREKKLVWDPSCGDGNLIDALIKKVDHKNTVFFGAESEEESYARAVKRFKNYSNVNIFKDDFIKYYLKFFAQNELFSPISQENIRPNVIIANPPYIRTQVMGAKHAQELAEKYSLKGRIDMYFAFLVSMINFLKDNGIIVVITSNRFLFTRSGESIRKYLLANLEILELYDLGDTKFFKAAVLPAILIGRKKKDRKNQGNIFYSKIYESTNEETCHKEIQLKKDLLNLASSGYKGLVKHDNTFYLIESLKTKISTNPDTPWTIDTQKKIMHGFKNKTFLIKDFFKVKVGIKTTADNVFIRNDWQNLPKDIQPENEVIRNLISSDDTERWYLSKEETRYKILYPYIQSEKREPIKLKFFPKTEKYLQTYKKQLESRKYLIEAGREWYEIWVPHKPLDWELPKIVFRDISKEPVFLFDNKNLLVNGNCYWIPARTKQEIDLLFLILGIANSKFIESYYDSNFSNKLYSGKRRFLTQYVEKFPIPDPESAIADEIIKLVRKNIEQKDNHNEKIEELINEYFYSTKKN